MTNSIKQLEKDNVVIEKVVKLKRNVDYKVLDQEIISFHEPEGDGGWSAENDDMIEESSKSHFIDIASRNSCLEGLKLAISRPKSIYCDFGCSSGWLIEDVLEQFPKTVVVGSDYFAAGLLKLKKRQPKLALYQFNLCDIPFANRSINAFSCLNVLEHIEEDMKALGELKRVLQTEGLGYIMVPAFPSLYDFYDKVHCHYRRYTKKEFVSKLKETGFVIKELNYLAASLFVPFFIVKKIKNRKLKDESFKEKKLAVQKEIKDTQNTSYSPLMSKILSMESKVARYIPYPFGIRLYAVVSKN